MKLKYKEWSSDLKLREYAAGGHALELLDTEDYCPILMCTVWTEGLQADEVAIKDYSENEGVLDWLIKNNIVEKPHRYIPSGFVVFPVCKLVEETLKRLKNEDIVAVDYVSVRDGDEFVTSAKVNLFTGEVFDIQSLDVSSNCYKTCDSEFVRMHDGKAFDVSESEGRYYIMF